LTVLLLKTVERIFSDLHVALALRHGRHRD